MSLDLPKTRKYIATLSEKEREKKVQKLNLSLFYYRIYLSCCTAELANEADEHLLNILSHN